MKRILAIDGGGIRGIIPAIFCYAFERWSKRDTCQLFDLIAGTSTGGIIALGLVKPTKGDPPHFLAKSLIDLYRTKGAQIFSGSAGLVSKLRGKFSSPKYDASSLERAMKDYFGQTELKDAVTPVMVTAYDIEERRPHVFKSWKAKDDRVNHNCLMAEAARATSAAPTYFTPAQVNERAFVDGGLYANNPSLLAYIEARKLWKDEEIVLVSLGTGTLQKSHRREKVEKWGQLQWIAGDSPLLQCIFNGISASVDHVLVQLLGLENYQRFQCYLPPTCESLDDTSSENIKQLETEGKILVSRYKGPITTLTDLFEKLDNPLSRDELNIAYLTLFDELDNPSSR